MRLLIIETCTERALVAIVEEGKSLFHVALPFGYQHSRHLLPLIDQALRELRLTMREIDAVVTGVGPGSYTGIRVGAMTAKTLAFVSQIPLVGICTLHAFVPSRAGPFAALIDAKIGGVYLALNQGAPEVLPLEVLGARLEEIQTLVTPNAAQIQAKLEKLYPGNRWQWEERAPDPLQMASLATEKLAAGEYTRDGHLELLYLRKTQAEIDRRGE